MIRDLSPPGGLLLGLILAAACWAVILLIL